MLTYACQTCQTFGTLISSTILRIHSNTLTLSYSASTSVVGVRLKLLNMIDNNTRTVYEFIFVTYDFYKTLWQMTFERLTYHPYRFISIYSFRYNRVIEKRTGGVKKAEFESLVILLFELDFILFVIDWIYHIICRYFTVSSSPCVTISHLCCCETSSHETIVITSIFSFSE